MRFISHRGNLTGRCDKENSPEQITKCLDLGYDVEIDVRVIGEDYFLGHDEPQYKVHVDFLKNDKLWCHAKNREALERMLSVRNIHCFWHQEDDYTLTSRSMIWVYPGKTLTTNSIAVMPELHDVSIDDLSACAGVCSDQIQHYKEILQQKQ
jgi:hypothetical protein